MVITVYKLLELETITWNCTIMLIIRIKNINYLLRNIIAYKLLS